MMTKRSMSIAIGLLAAAGLSNAAAAQSVSERCARGSGDAAISACNDIISSEPGAAGAFNNRGLAWHNKRDYDRAIADYNEAIRLNPKFPIFYNNRGNAWLGKEDYDRAIADYDEAIKLNQKYAMAYYNRGLAYEEKSNLRFALRDFKRFSELAPSDSDGVNAVSRIEARVRQQVTRKQASARPQQQPRPIVNTNFDSRPASRGQANLRQQTPPQQPAQQQPAQQQAPEKRAPETHAPQQQASVKPQTQAEPAVNTKHAAERCDKESRQGKTDACDEVIRANQKDYVSYTNRSRAWIVRKQYDKAIADNNQATKLSPMYANAYYNRALAYEARGDLRDALRDFKRFAEYAPWDPDGPKAVSRIEDKLSRQAPKQ